MRGTQRKWNDFANNCEFSGQRAKFPRGGSTTSLENQTGTNMLEAESLRLRLSGSIER